MAVDVSHVHGILMGAVVIFISIESAGAVAHRTHKAIMTFARYKISEADYIDALRLFSKLSPRSAGMLSLVAATLVALAVFGPSDAQVAALGAVVGGALGLLFYRYVFSPVFARHHYKRYKAIHEEFELEIVDDGLKMTAVNGVWIVRWDQTLKWRENDRFILIYPMPRLFYLVPKKGFSGPGLDFDLLRTKLSAHVGKAV